MIFKKKMKKSNSSQNNKLTNLNILNIEKTKQSMELKSK